MRGCEREEDKRKLGVTERERGRKKEGWKNKPESGREAEKETSNVGAWQRQPHIYWSIKSIHAGRGRPD